MVGPKVYKIEVGVEYPRLGLDDVFEISLSLFENEIQEIIEKAKNLYWVDNAIDGWEYLELSQSAYHRAIEIAEKTAVSIWGNKMLTENGARYDFFLPDEINEAIFDSPDAIKEQEIRKHRQDISRVRFRADAKTLKEEYGKGRWTDLLLPEPQWDNQIIYGSWSSSSGERAAQYSLGANANVLGKEIIKTSYDVHYRRDDVIIWIDVYSYNELVENLLYEFISSKGNLYGHNDFTTRIIDYPATRSIRLIVSGISQEADLNMYMSLLDELISLKEL